MIERLKKIDWTRTMFLVPIFLVAGISISHVVTWYDMANPINWAVYLSIAIEVGAMTSLMAATKKIKGGVWFMFGLVTFIQMIGNIFYSYKEIDVNGELFKSWVELTGPIWEATGTDLNDSIGMRRWLAFLEGGLLPLISLTALHFFVKYEKSEETEEVPMNYRPSTDEVPIKELNDEEKQNVADEIINSFIPDEKVFEELKYEEPLDGLDITEITEEEFKKGRPVSEITKELAKDFKKKVKTEETLGPIEEENPLDEILEGLEDTPNKDIEEEKPTKELPDIVKKTQEKFYPNTKEEPTSVKNTQVEDDGRRRVLEDDGKKRTLVYKKRNRGGQSSITRI